jgi:hypothetical protein
VSTDLSVVFLELTCASLVYGSDRQPYARGHRGAREEFLQTS